MSVAEKIHEAHLHALSRKEVKRMALKSIHSSMYHAPEVYELERRAIFSKRWILVSHKARYPQIGDFVQYEMAGFNFIVVRNKMHNIIAFHNICRHRAFPIVQAPHGKARIFSCKYHGWSYDLNGKLTKAPRFSDESLDGFDTENIRLFPVHVHIDCNGFVYVNLDAKETPEISWVSQYGAMDKQDVLLSSGIDWDKIEFDLTWVKEANFNWKLMQENYNECYHCLTAHPDVARTTSLDTYFVVSGSPGAYISHFSEPKSSTVTEFDEVRFTGRSATHVFPTGHFSPNPGTGFMHLMRTVPTGPTTSRQEYDVYKLNTPNATSEAHDLMLKFYQKVTQEDIDLCNNVQRSMNRRVFASGPLHPFYEEGVNVFQKTTMEILRKHLEQEEEIGFQVWPAEISPSGGESGDMRLPSCRMTRDFAW